MEEGEGPGGEGHAGVAEEPVGPLGGQLLGCAERAPVIGQLLDVGYPVLLVGAEETLKPGLPGGEVDGALAISGTRAMSAALTAEPMAPEEPSIFSSAGERRSMKRTAPSAASTGSFFATFLISATAFLMRVIAGWDFQPKAPRRKRALNSQGWAAAFAISARSGSKLGGEV